VGLVIGKLRHRVTIQNVTVTRNTRGAEVLTWSNLATVYADIRTVGGQEQVLANQLDDEIEIDLLPDERYMAGHLLSMANEGHISVDLTRDMEAGEECLCKYERGNLDKMDKANDRVSSWAPVLRLPLQLSLSLACSLH
jgi:hypothetical protein